MKLFTKVALVSAIAISGNAMAMQAMDDGALSSATGQDGISIALNTTGITIGKLLVHDNDGLTEATGAAVGAVANNYLQAAGGTDTAGAIVISDISVAKAATGTSLPGTTLASIHIDTDAGATGTEPFLNVGVILDALHIEVGSIAVGSSNAAVVGARRGATNETKILSGYTDTDKIEIDLVGASKLNIQLGHAPQGAMIKANGTIAGGIKLSNVAVVDAAGGGAIGIDGIAITTAGSNNLVVNTDISATANGLVISGTGSNDIYLSAVRFGSATDIGTATSTIGSAASIGSVEIQALDMGTSSIVVRGH
jgi:hypothetical protein